MKCGNFMLASLMSLIFQLIFVEEGNLNVFLMLGMIFVAQGIKIGSTFASINGK
jgi:hypothetical protein